MSKRTAFETIIFFLGFLLILFIVTTLFIPKEDVSSDPPPIVNLLISPYLISEKLDGFYSEEPHSLDVVFLGSSNVNCDINPNVIWDRFGITSYNFTSEQQELGTSYYYLKQMFETQSPKVVFIDVFKSGSERSIENVQAHFAFDYMKHDLNRAEAIWNRTTKDRLEMFLPVIRYHERWKSLNRNDFLYRPGQHNRLKGAVIYMSARQTEPVTLPESIPQKTLPERTVFWLDSIRQLCRENDCACVFIKTPLAFYDEEMFTDYAAIEAYCRENDVPFLFMNRMTEEIGIDFSTDYADQLHFNWNGQKKLSIYLGNYLRENYRLPDKRGMEGYAQWDEDHRVMMDYIDNFDSLYAKAQEQSHPSSQP